MHRGLPADERKNRLRAKSVEHSPASHLKPGPRPSILGSRAVKVKPDDDEDKMDTSAGEQSIDPAAADAVEEPEVQLGTSEEDEDNMDLDEADFEDAERQFNKDLEHINAKRPASPKHHPEILALLEEVDALARAQDHLEKGLPIPPPETDEAPLRSSMGLPTPTSEPMDTKGTQEDVEFEDASVTIYLTWYLAFQRLSRRSRMKERRFAMQLSHWYFAL